MFYEFDLETPKDRAETAPLETRVKLQYGIITKASFQFPGGCAGLAHVRAFMGGQQIWPRNRGESLKGNGAIIELDEWIELRSAWNEIVLYTWNNDDTYNHTITVRVTVLPREVADVRALFSDIRNALILLLRRIGVLV